MSGALHHYHTSIGSFSSDVRTLLENYLHATTAVQVNERVPLAQHYRDRRIDLLGDFNLPSNKR